MPTINQLVRNGRAQQNKKRKAADLMWSFNTLKGKPLRLRWRASEARRLRRASAR